MTRRLVEWLRRAVRHWLITERNRRRWDRVRRRYD
jgi:hypothetical protein